MAVVTSACGSRSCAARSMAWNRSVLIGLSSGAFGGNAVVKCTAVSFTMRLRVARRALDGVEQVGVDWTLERRLRGKRRREVHRFFVHYALQGRQKPFRIGVGQE